MNQDDKARCPTVEEAVSHILDTKLDAYKRQCITYWREKYGDGFADEVRAMAHKKLKK